MADQISHNRLYSALLGAAVLSISPQAAHALRIDYVLDLTAERNDNLLLRSIDPISLTILRPGIGFDVSHDSSMLQTQIIGRAEYRRYGDDRFDDVVDGNLSGRVHWVAIPERLSFTLVDNLTLQPVDTLAADTPGNRQQVNVLSAGPTLSFDWGANWRGAAELRYVRTEAEITDQFDSDRVDLALRAIKPLSATSRLAFNVQTQQVNFQNDLIARDYTRSELFARYSRTLNQFDIVADVGYSHLGYRRDLPNSAGSRSDPLLRTDLTWRPNASHSLGVQFSSQFSDVAADSLASVGEDGELPTEVITGDTVVNASPYLDRRLDTQYDFSGTRWSFGVSPYLGRRRYEDIGLFDQDGRGVGIEANWRARDNVMLGFSGTLGRIDYVNLDRQDETRRYAGYVRYDWARHWSGTLSLGRYQRTSTAAGLDADQNEIGLTASYRNR
jgi:hypothetical protein